MAPGALSSPVLEGDIVADKYRVEQVLGAGGMGIVVAARHVQLGQLVALKFLHGESVADPEAVARLEREARAAVQIQGDHVARVLDFGVLAGGAPFIVMEYLVGADLRQLLRQNGPLPVPEAVTYVLQACEALAEAHAMGIVHRDLKPANMFLARRPDGSGTIKVLDFGVSKSLVRSGEVLEQASLTGTLALLGSPAYMSPEQMRSAKHVDARTDIWALGVILHELLTAKAPFEAETLAGLCAAVARDPPARVTSLRADVPVGLESIILRCLEKEPADRPRTVSELAQMLLPYGPVDADQSARRVARIASASASDSVGSGTAGGTGVTAAPWVATANVARTGKLRVVALGGAAVLLAGAIGLFAWRSTRAPVDAALAPATSSVAAMATPAAAPVTSPAPLDESASAMAPTEPPDAAPARSASEDAGAPNAVDAGRVRHRSPSGSGARGASEEDLLEDRR